MKIRYIFQLTFLMLFLLACDEKGPDKLNKRNFVPGQVVIGVTATVPLNQVFDLMNDKAVFIEKMNGFFYYSTLPKDSLEYVKNILKSKPYTQESLVEEASAFLSRNNSRIEVTESLFQMDRAAQEDWLSTMDLLNLKDLGNDTRSIIIEVTPGTEQYWMDIFKEHTYVKWVDLNYIGGFEPI